MTDPIQRYVVSCASLMSNTDVRAKEVAVVLAADAEAHEAEAVAAARAEVPLAYQDGYQDGVRQGQRDASTEGEWQDGYESGQRGGYLQGQRDAEARIRAGVEALETFWDGMNVNRYAVLAVIDAAPQDERKWTGHAYDCPVHYAVFAECDCIDAAPRESNWRDEDMGV